MRHTFRKILAGTLAVAMVVQVGDWKWKLGLGKWRSTILYKQN